MLLSPDASVSQGSPCCSPPSPPPFPVHLPWLILMMSLLLWPRSHLQASARLFLVTVSDENSDELAKALLSAMSLERQCSRMPLLATPGYPPGHTAPGCCRAAGRSYGVFLGAFGKTNSFQLELGDNFLPHSMQPIIG